MIPCKGFQSAPVAVGPCGPCCVGVRPCADTAWEDLRWVALPPTPSRAGPERALRILQGLDCDSLKESLVVDQLITNNTTKHNQTPRVM